MRRALPVIFLVTAGAAACGPQKFTSHLTHYCSVDPNDDPYYTCAKGLDLVCINTYSIPVMPVEGPPSTRPAYICRLACEPGEPCRDQTEICCPGKIKGVTYGKTHACVPAAYCETIDAAPARDGGAMLRPPTDGSIGEMGRDGPGAPDTGSALARDTMMGAAPDAPLATAPDVAQAGASDLASDLSVDAPMAPDPSPDGGAPAPDAPAPDVSAGGDARGDA